MSQDPSWINEIIRIAGKNFNCNIVDVGANVGEVSKLLLHYFPSASILCFEPCENSYQQLVKNIGGIDRVKCFQLALSCNTGEAMLHTFTNNLCNTLNSGLSESWLEPVGVEIVKTVTLDEISRLHNFYHIDILKIDVEGYELNVLKGALTLLKNHRIRFIYAEVGFHRNKRHQYFGDIFDFIASLDYELCGFYDVFRDGKKNQYTVYCNALFMLKPRRAKTKFMIN